MTDGVANLIDNHDVTVTLLAEPLSWRVRVVEEVVVDTATSCVRRRSLQVAPLRELLAPWVTVDDRFAMLALNVVPMPRSPLMDFDVSGPLGDAWVLPRIEIALRQSQYLTGLVAEAGVGLPDGAADVLEAAIGFAGQVPATDDLATFLADGVGEEIAPSAVDALIEIGRRCEVALGPAIEGDAPLLAVDNPGTVLPLLIARDVVGDVEAGLEAIENYAVLLEEMAAHAPTADAAAEFLVALADYGRNYDLMVAMKVPLDEPFLIKSSERRRLGLSRFANAGEQELVIADAQTNHVTFRIPDPNTRIAAFSARKLAGDGFAFGLFAPREDNESWSFYGFDPDRDYRVRLTFRLALLRRLQFVPYLAALVLALLAVALIHERPSDLQTVALIAGPSALASTILLGREPSTLGSRLRLASTYTVTLSLIFLLFTAVSVYVFASDVGPDSYHESPGGRHGKEHRSRVPSWCGHGSIADQDRFGHLGEAEHLKRPVHGCQEGGRELQRRP